MARQTFPLVRGRVMRVTRLDGCGAVASAECSAIVSDGFVSVALTAVINEGEAINVTNAAGRVCVSDTPAPSFTGYTVVITFCQVDPALYAMMTGQAQVFNSDGDVVGFRMSSDVDSSDSGFALEVWSNVPSVACSTEGAAGTYGYTLLPFVQGGVLGDFTIENNAVTFTVQNAATKTGSGWDVGPYDVVLDDTDPSPLLLPIGTGDHLHIQLTEVAPPEPSDDCIASGPAPTGATAGIPGVWTPTDAYAASTLAEMSGITASPSTAWTTGQYMLLDDGSKAHWNGTAWAAGPA